MASRELVEEIKRRVIEDIDVELKVAEKTQEVMKKCGQAFRELQTQQRDSTRVLSQAMDQCLDAQKSFRQENQKLIEVVRDLGGTMKRVPLGPLFPNAWTPRNEASPTQASPKPSCSGDGSFQITLRKADGVGLGLKVSVEENDEALRVDEIVTGGAVEAWNRQCARNWAPGDDANARAVLPGDLVMSVNGITHSAQRMLEECQNAWLFRLVVVRQGASQAGIGEAVSSDSSLRMEAPEFVPISHRTPTMNRRRRQMSDVTPPKQALAMLFEECEGEDEDDGGDCVGKREVKEIDKENTRAAA